MYTDVSDYINVIVSEYTVSPTHCGSSSRYMGRIGSEITLKNASHVGDPGDTDTVYTFLLFRNRVPPFHRFHLSNVYFAISTLSQG